MTCRLSLLLGSAGGLARIPKHVEGGNTVTLGRKPDPEVGISVKFPIESPHELVPAGGANAGAASLAVSDLLLGERYSLIECPHIDHRDNWLVAAKRS